MDAVAFCCSKRRNRCVMQKGKWYVKHAVRGLARSSVTPHTQGVDPYCTTRDARYSRGRIASKRFFFSVSDNAAKKSTLSSHTFWRWNPFEDTSQEVSRSLEQRHANWLLNFKSLSAFNWGICFLHWRYSLFHDDRQRYRWHQTLHCVIVVCWRPRSE